MAKKKRRTELDIDPSILTEAEEAPLPEQDEPTAPAPDVEKELKTKEEAPAEPKVKKGKFNKAKLALIAAGGMGAVSLAAAIVWGIMTLSSGKTETPEQAEVEAKDEPVVAAPEIEVDIPPIFTFKPFLVNLGEGEDSRLVKVTFSAQMSDAKVSEEIKRNLVLIRENIYFFLQSKSVDMFQDKEKKKRMAVDMAIVLNRSIQSGAVTKVLVFGLIIK